MRTGLGFLALMLMSASHAQAGVQLSDYELSQINIAMVSNISNNNVVNGAISGTGNVIGAEAFKNAFGVMAINVNSGANTSVQQAVYFQSGAITIGTASEPPPAR